MITATAPQSPVTTPVPRTARPGLAATIRVEFTKLTAQWPLRITFAICVIAPIAFAVFVKAEWPSGPSDTLFGRWSGTTGFAESLTLLNFASIYGAPALAGLFAGDIFAGEDRQGTWKMLLTRSASRTRIFAGKAIAAIACVWGSFLTAALASLIVGIAIDGRAPLVGLSGQLIPNAQSLQLTAASWAFALLPATAFTALALLLSIATPSTAAGVLGPLVIAAALQILETVDGSQLARTLSPATPLDAWHALLTSPGHSGTILAGAAISLAWTSIFAGLAWHLLRKRAFAASDTTPRLQRRAIAQITAAAVVILTALAAASGQGPSALTAQRLDASIATTFANLAVIHAQWQTGTGGTAPHIRAVCTRGAGYLGANALKGQGQGDDWSCTMTDTRTSDAEQPVVLDVTSKANGCYEAEAGSSLGALLITSWQGQTFINPLYAFDGCLGTL
jgi:ABC-2 type transport system permease protein